MKALLVAVALCVSVNANAHPVSHKTCKLIASLTKMYWQDKLAGMSETQLFVWSNENAPDENTRQVQHTLIRNIYNAANVYDDGTSVDPYIEEESAFNFCMAIK
jgi:hypothetical protein